MNYPFVRVSDDIKFLFADFYLGYSGSSLHNGNMQIVWLYGFGDIANSPISGRPTPVHDYDLIVADLSGNTLFNTTTAGFFSYSDWDNRLRILEWRGTSYTMRAVIHTAWDPAEEPTAPSYDLHIEPAEAILDPHTIYQVPQHVTAIRVSGQTLPSPVVVVEEGYNVGLSAEVVDDQLTLGEASLINKPTQVTISAIPGSGLGIFPGCTDTVPDVKAINGVSSGPFQNFNLDADGCIRIQRPVALTASSPRTFAYQSTGLTGTQAASAIALGNGCKPCCDCSYFVRTYQGLKRQWNLYQAAATTAEGLRDDYRNIVGRWLTEKGCRESDTVRVITSPDGSSKISWGVVHCNASKCCLVNVQARLTWVYKVDGVVRMPIVPGYDCQKTEATGPAFGESSTRIFSGRSAETQGIVNVFNWANSDSQSNTTLAGRHCFPEAQNIGDSVLQVQAHWCISWDAVLPEPETGDVCDYPLLTSADFPDEVKAMWALTGDPIPTNGRFQKLADVVTVDIEDPFCERCECESPVPTKPVTPKKLPLICHWLDGKDTRTLDLFSNNVLEWRSKKGDMMTLKPSPLHNPPTYDSGAGIVLFNGTNQSLSNAFYQLTLGGGFIAIVGFAASTNQVFFSSRITGTPTANYTLLSDRSRIGDTEATGMTGTNQLSLVVATYTAGTIGVVSSLFHNGTLVSTVNTTRSDLGEGVFIGVNSDLGTGFLSGGIGELLIGCFFAATTDRQIVEGYLAHKWGLQGSLPSGHPYKTNPPLG
jgi:hypothetical protein